MCIKAVPSKAQTVIELYVAWNLFKLLADSSSCLKIINKVAFTVWKYASNNKMIWNIFFYLDTYFHYFSTFLLYFLAWLWTNPSHFAVYVSWFLSVWSHVKYFALNVREMFARKTSLFSESLAASVF